jgi:uncharacterized protein (TIGR03118 family)
MKKLIFFKYRKSFDGLLLILLSFVFAGVGCKHHDRDDFVPPITNKSYVQTNLVSNVSGYGNARIDANLANAWGIAIGPTGAFWISSNHAGLTTIYDRNGAQLLAPISIPFNGTPNGGSPTGVVYNNTPNFIIPANNQASKFIYASEDGTLTAWNSGTSAVTVADKSATAVYKGLALASDGGANFLYAANFKEGKIDVFDKDFKPITTKPFLDPSIPAGFAPFNIQSIGNELYVTYAKQKAPDNMDDQKGLGNGYINIFNPDGTLVKRFASQGTLNSPWGITRAPEGFGLGQNMILVGNFGDGFINIFDANGSYKGQLKNDNTLISIDGLWALEFPRNNIPAGDQNQLFFTAGPNDETNGLFGYIARK